MSGRGVKNLLVMTPSDRILVPLDTTDVNWAAGLADRLRGHVGGIKLGKEFISANGPHGVRQVVGNDQPLFLDVKFHDIPNTVAGAIRSLGALQPFMVNVHAFGGRTMMEAAVAANAEAGAVRPLILAVTVLTSLDNDDLAELGVYSNSGDQVVRLAQLAQDCGVDGAVCSPKEIALLRDACGPDFKLVVPGIRPTWASVDDQKRIATPADAVAMGADYLVIGRPITGADDPVAAAERIGKELAAV